MRGCLPFARQEDEMNRCDGCGHSEQQHERERFRRRSDGRLRARNVCSPSCGCQDFAVGDEHVDEDAIWMRMSDERLRRFEPCSDDEDDVPSTWDVRQLA
jgi:hypothetical protein